MHYSNGTMLCACCPVDIKQFEEHMTLDHISGGGNAHRKSIRTASAGYWYWFIKNGFPDGYQVLCYNCNLSKGHKGSCPHTCNK